MKKQIRPGRLLLLCLLLSGIAFQAQAETQENKQYISPRLQLGIHTEASLESPVKELISSGTAVEVIKTTKDFSQIKTAAKTEGWIKSKFLTAEEPSQLQVKKLELALHRSAQKLQELQAKSSSAQSSPDPNACSEQDSGNGNQENPDVQELAQMQKTAYEETIAGLKAELLAWEQLDSQDRQAQKEQAEKINLQLIKRLAKIAALATGDGEHSSSYDLPLLSVLSETENDSQLTFMKKFKKDYMILLIIAGLGFFLGVFVMDLHNRKRHGGFRV